MGNNQIRDPGYLASAKMLGVKSGAFLSFVLGLEPRASSLLGKMCLSENAHVLSVRYYLWLGWRLEVGR